MIIAGICLLAVFVTIVIMIAVSLPQVEKDAAVRDGLLKTHCVDSAFYNNNFDGCRRVGVEPGTNQTSIAIGGKQ